eukprot:UN27718
MRSLRGVPGRLDLSSMTMISKSFRLFEKLSPTRMISFSFESDFFAFSICGFFLTLLCFLLSSLETFGCLSRLSPFSVSSVGITFFSTFSFRGRLLAFVSSFFGFPPVLTGLLLFPCAF